MLIQLLKQEKEIFLFFARLQLFIFDFGHSHISWAC